MLVLLIISVFLLLYALGVNKNIIKTILLLNMLQSNIILLFLSLNSSSSKLPPILPTQPSLMVDPMPQALMITAIVIGASITSLSIMMSIKIFHNFGTLRWDALKEEESWKSS